MYENIMPLILASSSPRRRYLLERAGITFQVIPSRLDEESCAGGFASLPGVVEFLAQKKAESVIERRAWFHGAVLAADTVVTLGERILGKPASVDEAREMLRQLSNRTHRVWTGVCIVAKLRNVERWIWSCCTEVEFRNLSDEEIEAYIATGEPFDKAGGYGIQGIASGFVKNIKGSYTNVVGLPLAETIQALIDLKVIRPRHPF